MSKYIPNTKQAQKSQWMWSSKPYSKAEREKEERENKEYRDKLEAVKNRIESIPLEQLSFRDLYTEPFIKDKIMGWVYSGDNFIFQFLGDNEDTNNKCLQILNDEITEYNRQDVKHLNGEITVNSVPFILIRGWGNLTSSGGYNLDGDYACKIQDTLAEYIVEKLNFGEKENKKTGEKEPTVKTQKYYHPRLSQTFNKYLMVTTNEAQSLEDLKDILERVESKIDSMKDYF